jgi:type III secretion protein T
VQVIVELSRAFDAQLIALMLSLPRIHAFLATSQLLATSSVPGLPRAAAILALAVMAVPINQDYAATFDRSAVSFIVFFAKEYVIGLLLGYLVGWIFWVVQAAGGLIDNQRGAAIASSIDPLQGEESSPLGNLLSQAFLTYVFTTGGVLLMLGIVYQSYVAWPAAKAVPIISDTFPAAILGIFDNAMRLAFNLAAPILAIMFAAEFSLAMISRFAPQIQVFVLAMPIKSILAIIVLIFYLQSFMPYAESQLATSRGYVAWFYELLKLGETVRQPAPGTGIGNDSR